jgi:hypothetical protein
MYILDGCAIPTTTTTTTTPPPGGRDICGKHGEGRGVYRVLVGRPEGKRPLGRPRRRWDDNIKMDLTETGVDGANLIQLAQDRVQWLAFVNTIMILLVP